LASSKYISLSLWVILFIIFKLLSFPAALYSLYKPHQTKQYKRSRKTAQGVDENIEGSAGTVGNEILMNFRAQKKYSAEISINETIDVDRDGNPLAYIDVISSEENMAEEIERQIMSEKAMKCIKTVLNLRERQIIIMRYGLCGSRELTQREIAERLGISRSYVSRIEKSALEKLKSALGG
jgi:RNA polymerase sporulation-specific sigma factor